MSQYINTITSEEDLYPSDNEDQIAIFKSHESHTRIIGVIPTESNSVFQISELFPQGKISYDIVTKGYIPREEKHIVFPTFYNKFLKFLRIDKLFKQVRFLINRWKTRVQYHLIIHQREFIVNVFTREFYEELLFEMYPQKKRRAMQITVLSDALEFFDIVGVSKSGSTVRIKHQGAFITKGYELMSLLIKKMEFKTDLFMRMSYPYQINETLRKTNCPWYSIGIAITHLIIDLRGMDEEEESNALDSIDWLCSVGKLYHCEMICTEYGWGEFNRFITRSHQHTAYVLEGTCVELDGERFIKMVWTRESRRIHQTDSWALLSR